MFIGAKQFVIGRRQRTFWNPADKTADVTLSNGNLTATNAASNAWRGLRSVASHLTGKYYSEVTMTSIGINTMTGIANSTNVLAAYLGNSNNGIGWATDGKVYRNAGIVTTIQTYTTGSVCCIAVDMDNLKLWFRTDGGNWNNAVIGSQDPANNVGGISFSALGTGPWFSAHHQYDTSSATTTNFGSTAYAQSVPSGFSNW